VLFRSDDVEVLVSFKVDNVGVTYDVTSKDDCLKFISLLIDLFKISLPLK
jgi:hypothetical protein